MMHLDVSTPQGPELHLDVHGHQEPVLLLYVNFSFLNNRMLPIEVIIKGYMQT
jgi:hypothetical protein